VISPEAVTTAAVELDMTRIYLAMISAASGAITLIVGVVVAYLTARAKSYSEISSARSGEAHLATKTAVQAADVATLMSGRPIPNPGSTPPLVIVPLAQPPSEPP